MSNFVTCPPSALPYPLSQQRIIDSIHEKERELSRIKLRYEELIYTDHTSGFIASPQTEYEAKQLEAIIMSIDADLLRNKMSLNSSSLFPKAIQSSSYNQAVMNNPPPNIPIPYIPSPPSNPLPKRVVDNDNPYDGTEYAPLQRRLTVQRIKSLLQEDQLIRYSSCPDCKKRYGTPHYSCDHCNPPSELMDAVKLIAELAHQLDQKDAAKSSGAAPTKPFNPIDQAFDKAIGALKDSEYLRKLKEGNDAVKDMIALAVEQGG